MSDLVLRLEARGLIKIHRVKRQSGIGLYNVYRIVHEGSERESEQLPLNPRIYSRLKQDTNQERAQAHRSRNAA
jgi:hypothetical protein